MEYPRIDVTVDLALFSLNENGDVQVLLIRRGKEPFKGYLAIPGGYLNPNESLKQAAERELYEETHTVAEWGAGKNKGGEVFYVGVYDDPDRDPRGRVISHLFAAFTKEQLPEAGDDAEKDSAHWAKCPIEEPMAFDHQDMIGKAYLTLLEAGQVPAG